MTTLSRRTFLTGASAVAIAAATGVRLAPAGGDVLTIEHIRRARMIAMSNPYPYRSWVRDAFELHQNQGFYNQLRSRQIEALTELTRAPQWKEIP